MSPVDQVTDFFMIHRTFKLITFSLWKNSEIAFHQLKGMLKRSVKLGKHTKGIIHLLPFQRLLEKVNI